MIVILDYGLGNIGSIANMLKKIGVNDVIVSNDETVIQAASHLIIPGVGAFDTGMNNIRRLGLEEIIWEHAVKNNKPTLGICLGMQLLGLSSEEGKETGLGLIEFRNIKYRFSDEVDLKIPHMGWNYVNIMDKEDPLSRNLTDSERYYFVHSYYAHCESDSNILMKATYGFEFTAAVKHNNIYGVQFHPEKSHKYGMQLLSNFVREVRV